MEKILLAGIVLCAFMVLMSMIDGSDSSGKDTRTGGPSGCGWILILAIIVAVLFFSGCAETPPMDSPFPGAAGWTERRADPGRVLDERVTLGPTGAGEGRAGYPTLCGFVDFAARLVWIARAIDCPLEETRRHENCHIQAREAGIKDECHDGRSYTQ